MKTQRTKFKLFTELLKKSIGNTITVEKDNISYETTLGKVLERGETENYPEHLELFFNLSQEQLDRNYFQLIAVKLNDRIVAHPNKCVVNVLDEKDDTKILTKFTILYN